ncbi:MAG: membrane dipeptidase [Firmicutes bacterium]|jgi:membrane dipeptidase|nr:membrane dipeptidase [Bacillota bacterium]
MDKYFVIDGHCDVLYQLEQEGGKGSLSERLQGQVDLKRLREGGVVAQFFALYGGEPNRLLLAQSSALKQIKLLYRELKVNPDLVLAYSRDDVIRARDEGKIAVVLSMEGGEALGDDPGLLEVFYQLGVRAIGLTWNDRNLLASGVGDTDSGSGLTSRGRETVKIAQELGMLLDVSHLSQRSFWDLMDLAEGPIIASHSSAYALCAHPRNLSDEQAQKLAQTGGVIGVNFHSPFLREQGQAELTDVVNHIDYLAQLVGPEHVGIGSDFDGIPVGPQGLEDPHCFPALAQALKERGYSNQEIQNIMGANFLRILPKGQDVI